MKAINLFTMKKIILLAGFLAASHFTQAQNLTTQKNWFTLDYAQDGIRGMSVEKAYQTLLKNRPSQKVLVAIIDSGVDILHEDLQGKIWVNSGEIPGNGKDDDKNGFIDDVHGWDFLGAADGRDIREEQLEITRMYAELLPVFGSNPSKKTIRKQKATYEAWKTWGAEIEAKKAESAEYLKMYQDLYNSYRLAVSQLTDLVPSPPTEASVRALDDSKLDRTQRQAKQYFLQMAGKGITQREFEEAIKHFESQTKYAYNPNHTIRKIVGDNPTKLEYGQYGNNEVVGPDASHGTHVAGIIGAVRGNGIGVDGVANQVSLMVLRCVPDGDERDKDVANAIRYAVDNGAQIINMSFGKKYSPQKKWVDDAVLYAQSKGVLLVAAAGNDNANTDTDTHYPTDLLLGGKTVANWISVGAQNHLEGSEMVAEFSNFGKQTVDVFAPGVAIYSTYPNSTYKEENGTSMAAPAVTGVAALLKSYFPMLKAEEIKDIILTSATRFPELKVSRPGSNVLIPFSDLSQTGGVVNAYEAVKLAIERTKP